MTERGFCLNNDGERQCPPQLSSFNTGVTHSGKNTLGTLEELHLPQCLGALRDPAGGQEDVAGEKDIWAAQLTLLPWRPDSGMQLKKLMLAV